MKARIREGLAGKPERRLSELPDLLTTFEVASFLRVSRWTLSEWRKNGTGPPFARLSRGILRYPKSGLEPICVRPLRFRQPAPIVGEAGVGR